MDTLPICMAVADDLTVQEWMTARLKTCRFKPLAGTVRFRRR